ncbi:MAG: SDR family oxidoreductase [Pseudomonadota bacterium]
MSSVVLVTGTSSGIGRACVARFQAAGWQVIATVRRPEDAAALRAEFRGIEVLEADLTDEDSVTTVVGSALQRRGRLDALVNNAGASIIGAAEELSLADYRAQLELNLLAAIGLTQLALPYMRAQGSGRIVQVSSGFGRIALPMFAAYCASKYALEGFSEALAHEVAPAGIGVSLIEPGAVATHFDRNRREASGYRADGPYRNLYRIMRARLATTHGRGASTADDVAATIFRAVSARRPALRYTVGRMGLAALLVARCVPDRLKQLAIARLLRG